MNGIRRLLSQEIAASATPAPALWPGSQLERRLLAIKRELDEYRAREDKAIMGSEQLRWMGESTRVSAAAGVAWRGFVVHSFACDTFHLYLFKPILHVRIRARAACKVCVIFFFFFFFFFFLFSQPARHWCREALKRDE